MLVDSNIIIYAAEPENIDLQRFLYSQPRAVSIAGYIEVLGFRGLEDYQMTFFEDFFREVRVLHLTPEIADRAVTLRQQRRMGLGDAIIAVTGLEHNLTLLTRNTRDFRWINGLRLLNPMEEQE